VKSRLFRARAERRNDPAQDRGPARTGSPGTPAPSRWRSRRWRHELRPRARFLSGEGAATSGRIINLRRVPRCRRARRLAALTGRLSVPVPGRKPPRAVGDRIARLRLGKLVAQAIRRARGGRPIPLGGPPAPVRQLPRDRRSARYAPGSPGAETISPRSARRRAGSGPSRRSGRGLPGTPGGGAPQAAWLVGSVPPPRTSSPDSSRSFRARSTALRDPVRVREARVR
jgi:hypothetical protein